MRSLLSSFSLTLIIAFFVLPGYGQLTGTSVQMGKVSLDFSLDGSGKPVYAVRFSDKPVILPSTLGFVLEDDSLFDRGFRILAMHQSETDETWSPVWGEERHIRNHYHNLIVELQEDHPPYRLLNLEFRVFSDGVGFRYIFPRQPALRYFVVREERTIFRMAGDHKAFWIPGDFDTNEYPYTVCKLSEVDNSELVRSSTSIAVRVAPDPQAVQTPLMMKTSDGLYLNLHEAALVNYPAMQLHVDHKSLALLTSLVPDAVGNKAYLHAPFATPWRTLIVSDKAADILSSRLILNLNEPSRVGDSSWIHPMKFVGVWWEMQTGRSTWNYSDYPDSLGADAKLIPNGRHGANTTNVKRYIDFAASNQIPGVLVEGWNTGWEDWFGNWKENVFDFVSPYPDFDVRELSSYAASKGVQLIMHNETSGSATNYERQMDTAFRFMNRFGYHSVKTGYVGKIIPRGEHHDGQWMVNHYLRVAQKAAQYHVMLDAHEPVRPTGLQRTYPNWLACEAGRGNEYNAFSDGNSPAHETIMPFTRMIGGPMDYTPGIFRIKNYSSVPVRQVHTTLAKQLALYVVFFSPLQMAADLPENYVARPDAFQFIRDVPLDWDTTLIREAEPGEYLLIVRKERGKDNWFAGAITNEKARNLRLRLDFLPAGKKFAMRIYQDGKEADWKNNPESYQILEREAKQGMEVPISLAPGGGAAISIIEMP